MFLMPQDRHARKEETENTAEERARISRFLDSLNYDIERKQEEFERVEKSIYDLEIRRKNLKEDLERLLAEKKRLTQSLDRMEIH